MIFLTGISPHKAIKPLMFMELHKKIQDRNIYTYICVYI